MPALPFLPHFSRNALSGLFAQLALAAACFGGASVWAQTGEAAPQRETPKVQGAELLSEGEPEVPRSAVRLYQQDAGSRVEELRVRGETQEITVTPSGRLPSYEVQPRNSRSYPADSGRHSSDGTTGPRRWKIGEF